MLKVLAAVLAVLSAAISITIYTATLPDVQKQAADNASAIEQNAKDISSVGNSVDGLNTRLETLEDKDYFKIIGNYDDTLPESIISLIGNIDFEDSDYYDFKNILLNKQSFYVNITDTNISFFVLFNYTEKIVEPSATIYSFCALLTQYNSVGMMGFEFNITDNTVNDISYYEFTS